MAIRIFITGGTIDNLEYSKENLSPRRFKSLIPKLLKQARVAIDYQVTELMHKDSRFITVRDREFIFQSCKAVPEQMIIITHGTATLSKTAEYLAERIKNKTIVLFGAIIPANKNNSDAMFNLGGALIAVQNSSKGVYVSMNGKIFKGNNVRKNKKIGIFEKEK